jgi:hypothetical protein
MTNSQIPGFNWRLPLWSVLVACAILISIAVCQTDTALFLYLFAIGPLLILGSILLLFYLAIGKGRQSRLTPSVALGVVWIVSICFFELHVHYPFAVRTPARWLLSAHKYKDEVLAQQVPTNGEFKHVEWDSWGFAGMDTTVYLVFDPTDSLSPAASVRQPGKFNGLPCEVPEVERLESQWYIVRFYTDRDWNQCNRLER